MDVSRRCIKKSIFTINLLASLFVLGGTASLMAETPSTEEMWRVIQQQQKTIESLQSKLNATERKVEETVEAIEVTADAIEVVTIQREKETFGTGTSIGGYGELHYNNLNDQNSGIGGDDSRDRADLHRFVLYFGHEFTDSIRFFSELEVEHSLAGDGAPGEVEIEQAWVELNLNDQHRLRAGLDILPIGIINPTHEPNTFYGVERNRVESEIIPATWWEAGLGLSGELAPGWNYDLVLHSGLAVSTTSSSSAFRPRSGRLKVAEADDQDFAMTGRIRYTAIPGLEIGISGQYQADITGTADSAEIEATLFEGHIDWKHESGFGLRALYARWDIGDDIGVDPAMVSADTLDGWYIEPAYRFNVGRNRWGDVGVFARYSRWDERNGISSDFKFEEFEQFAFGLNWWPHHNLAFKFDYQWEDADADVDALRDGFNLGIAYSF